MKLTTRAIQRKSIYRSRAETGELTFGGGAYNSHLLEQLRWRLRKHNWSVQTTDAFGWHRPGWRQRFLHGWPCVLFSNSVVIYPL